MNVDNGQLYGLGSYPTYDPSVFAKPRLPPAVAARIFGTDSATRSARPRRSSTARSRGSIRRARPSSRSPRWRRSTRAPSPRARSSPTAGRSISATGTCSTTRGNAAYGSINLQEALKVSSDIFFYTLGYRMDRPTTRATGRSELGAQARHRLADRDRHRRRGRRQAAHAGGAQRGLQDQHLQELALRRGRVCISKGESPTSPGRWATTSTSRSARATCRPTRCRWRPRTRRSPTAATWSARTSASASPTRRAHDPGHRPRGAQPRRHRPVVAHHDPRRPPRGGDRAGRHLLSGIRRLPGAGRRQDRHSPRPGQADQSWYIALARIDNPGTWSP